MRVTIILDALEGTTQKEATASLAELKRHIERNTDFKVSGLLISEKGKSK